MPRKLPRWPFGLAEGPPGSRPFAPLALLGSRWGARGVARGGPGGPRGNPTKLHVVFTGRGVLWSFVGGPCGVPRDLEGSPFDPSKWVDLFAGVPWASPGLSPGASWVPVRGPGGRQGGSGGPRRGSVGPLGVLSGARVGSLVISGGTMMHRHALPSLPLPLPQAFDTVSVPDYDYQVSPVDEGGRTLTTCQVSHTIIFL